MVGSTARTLIAGTIDAATPTSTMRPALTANVGASVGLICHKNDARSRVMANEPARPTAAPTASVTVRWPPMTAQISRVDEVAACHRNIHRGEPGLQSLTSCNSSRDAAPELQIVLVATPRNQNFPFRQLVLERALTGRSGLRVGTAWDQARDRVPRFPLRIAGALIS